MPVEAKVSMQQRRCNPSRVIEVVHRRLCGFEEHNGRDDGKDDRHDPVARASCRHKTLANFWGLFSAPCLSRHHRFTYFDVGGMLFQKACSAKSELDTRLTDFQKSSHR
jgi:hypothetical protein